MCVVYKFSKICVNTAVALFKGSKLLQSDITSNGFVDNQDEGPATALSTLWQPQGIRC